MAVMEQQQHAFMLQQQQQQMTMAQQQQQAPSNPFADPYMHAGAHPYGAGMQLHASNVYTGTGMDDVALHRICCLVLTDSFRSFILLSFAFIFHCKNCVRTRTMEKGIDLMLWTGSEMQV